MQFKGNHSDDSSSEEPKEEAAKEESASSQESQPASTQDAKLMKIEQLKQCLQYVNMHVIMA